ncbi:MAG: SufD family Fe-S cluster assembly protein [Eggerthella lenta]
MQPRRERRAGGRIGEDAARHHRARARLQGFRRLRAGDGAACRRRVANRTVPVILCDEDDVAGNHGATIGHVRPEQLFYLASRGISPEDAERLFITASFEEAAINAPDQRTRLSVTRLAAARGIEIEEAVA